MPLCESNRYRPTKFVGIGSFSGVDKLLIPSTVQIDHPINKVNRLIIEFELIAKDCDHDWRMMCQPWGVFSTCRKRIKFRAVERSRVVELWKPSARVAVRRRNIDELSSPGDVLYAAADLCRGRFYLPTNDVVTRGRCIPNTWAVRRNEVCSTCRFISSATRREDRYPPLSGPYCNY